MTPDDREIFEILIFCRFLLEFGANLGNFWKNGKIWPFESPKYGKNSKSQTSVCQLYTTLCKEGLSQFLGLLNHLVPQKTENQCFFGPFFLIWDFLYISRLS